MDAGGVRRVSAATKMQLADGEVVWFWRSEAGAKSAMMLTRLADDGGNQAMVTEESTYKLLKPLRREGRMIPAHLWFLPLCFFIAQGAMGATGTRPSLRPLLIPRVKVHAKARAHCAARSRIHISPSFARSALVRRSPPSGEGGCDEAIHPSLAARWIASLIGRRGAPTRWLAMTESRPRSCRSAPKRQTRNPRIRRCAWSI